MTNHEAIEILEEVKTLDDTMFAYSQAYNDALDMAIKALKAQDPETSDALKPDDNVGCWYDITHNYTLEQVVSALKSQEPRVMTLGDLRDIGSVWELNTPPYLWMDINPSYRWTRGFWVAWREIYDMIDGLHPTYDADNYGKIWRVWTSRPTGEQREATPWTQTNGL